MVNILRFLYLQYIIANALILQPVNSFKGIQYQMI